jgi:hypothetical protein
VFIAAAVFSPQPGTTPQLLKIHFVAVKLRRYHFSLRENRPGLYSLVKLVNHQSGGSFSLPDSSQKSRARWLDKSLLETVLPGDMSLPAVRRIATTLLAIVKTSHHVQPKSLKARIKMFVEKPEFDKGPG